MKLPLILASSSPRRKQLLVQIGLEFEVYPSQIHENLSLNLSPEIFTNHWAKQKAMDVAKSNPRSLIVAADTIVVLDHKILGKPKNKNDSYHMLKSLSGRAHKVFTGVHFSYQKYGIDRTINEQTKVSFNTLSDSDIYYYIKNSIILIQKYNNKKILRILILILNSKFRILKKNGFLELLNYVFFFKKKYFYKSIYNGLKKRIGKDMDNL